MARSTLENPLLYKRFLSTVERLNPDLDLDPEVIDRTLEYDEAFNALKRSYPNLRMSGKARNELEASRDCLQSDFWIDEPKVQNLIIQDDRQPFTEDGLGEISYSLHCKEKTLELSDKAICWL
ncbi:MAG: hypothetical protein MN733_43615 [Nitrososphaera sp.]|nr:hypothetical protein [Nitrososphaera sp.]